MGRLFAGTPWDRPPTCDRCGSALAECGCPPLPSPGEVAPDPSSQTARVKVERRPKGKVVTVVAGLDLAGGHLDTLAATLKSKVGTGGTVKEGRIELQGDRLDAVEAALGRLGYKSRRG